MKPVKSKQLIRALRRWGFADNGGSKHIKMTKIVDGKTVSVSIMGQGIIKSGTAERIRKQAQISKDVFYKEL